MLEKQGWRYVNANIWNKGKGHIAGNVNTRKIRRFPVVSEVCVQYVFQARIDGAPPQALALARVEAHWPSRPEGERGLWRRGCRHAQVP